jgi:hypothetical protein
MDNTKSEATVVHQEIFQKVAKGSRVALIYHLRVRNRTACNNWHKKSNELLESMAGSRLFNISVDPVPREGMSVDEIVIDEYPSTEVALKFVEAIQADLTGCCSVTVLAIQPESPLKFRIVRIIARLMHFFKGINDGGTPTANWKANNIAVWPDEKQMAVARKQDLNRPLLVYNLNKNKKMAQYHEPFAGSKPCSGEEAYEQYSKIAGKQLLRRGAYPVYGGKPLGILIGVGDNMLSDNWSKFILVYYPQRRNLLSMIEGEEFKSGQHHRDAGLERVAIFMGNDKRADAA